MRAVDALKIVPFCRQAGRTMTVRPGAILFREGEQPEGLFYVESGRVEVLVGPPEAGRHMTMRFARRGQWLGLEAVFASHPHESTARAAGHASVCFVPRAEFFAFFEANPDVRMRILYLMSEWVGACYALIRHTLDLHHERIARNGSPAPRLAAEIG